MEWEAKAPLGDAEMQSVVAIKAANERRPDLRLLKVRALQEYPVAISRQSTSLKLDSGLRSSTPKSHPSATAAASKSAHALHPKQPVWTPDKFYDWFTLIDRSVAHSHEAHFRQHLLRVSEHLDMCDKLVGRIDQVDAEVTSMLEKWRSIGESGRKPAGC